MNTSSSLRSSHAVSLAIPLVTILVSWSGAGSVLAAAIPVPNASFESPVPPFGIGFDIDSWEKEPNPGYFVDTPQLTWYQTVGNFYDTNPYGFGFHAAYILSLPGAGIFQDYDSMDWNDPAPSHGFDAVFEVGKAYDFTVGVYGKSRTPGSGMQNSILILSLFYRDGLGDRITIDSTMILFTPQQFPNVAPLSLIDFAVSIPEVLATDAWAGEKIGISIQAFQGTGDGYWDIDNVRLAETPEPGAAGLLAIGLVGLLNRRLRTRP
jgi:hypothetical protein